ncbi:MAG: glutamine-hydrolyzing GMP synthase, partial [Planctomycetes bacterium]|nr:glutamine-hydrolyzing GMP synthase [Planctomycetota bacterium]
PASVYEPGAPGIDACVLDGRWPVLGICYGMQLASQAFGGKVVPAGAREFGPARATVRDASDLFFSLPEGLDVWASHGDAVAALPADFEVLATTPNCPYAAVRHAKSRCYGVQFHPEVAHTPLGSKILHNFLFRICGARGTWDMAAYVETMIPAIREQVGPRHVVCALSGGVDSSVVAVLVNKAIGERLTCIFVDNGLLRKGESERVRDAFARHFGLHLIHADARERFLTALRGVTDPERKRKIIGHEFIDVFREAAREVKGLQILAQGTLYPDVIESASPFGGPSARIKSHHNVGGLPAELGFELLEPLRFLFKDEVREIGKALGMPEEVLWRQPFPGPGLGVRVIGDITPARLEILRNADTIVTDEVEQAGLARSLWQYFAVLLPIYTVGVMGDERTYEHVIAIRAVTSTDGMTADWARLPDSLLSTCSARIINEVKGVNRVVYDVSSKPPSTIEWE